MEKWIAYSFGGIEKRCRAWSLLAGPLASINRRKSLLTQSMPVTIETTEARRLLAIVEKSQIPESSQIFEQLKSKIDRGESLSTEEHERLLKLVKLAEDWEKAVQSSARTEREETMPG